LNKEGIKEIMNAEKRNKYSKKGRTPFVTTVGMYETKCHAKKLVDLPLT
jgi:hypothetical protein